MKKDLTKLLQKQNGAVFFASRCSNMMTNTTVSGGYCRGDHTAVFSSRLVQSL